MIIHIKYVKPATKGFTAHDYGGFHFVEAPGQVPTLSSPKSGPIEADEHVLTYTDIFSG